MNSTIYATPKCQYMFLSLTQCFFTPPATPHKNLSFCSQSLHYSLCLDKHVSDIKKKKGKEKTRFSDNANQVVTFPILTISFLFFPREFFFLFCWYASERLFFPKTLMFSSRKWIHVDLRVDNIKIHYISLVSRYYIILTRTWWGGKLIFV